jgi:hypothetical protein
MGEVDRRYCGALECLDFVKRRVIAGKKVVRRDVLSRAERSVGSTPVWPELGVERANFSGLARSRRLLWIIGHRDDFLRYVDGVSSGFCPNWYGRRPAGPVIRAGRERFNT